MPEYFSGLLFATVSGTFNCDDLLYIKMIFCYLRWVTILMCLAANGQHRMQELELV